MSLFPISDIKTIDENNSYAFIKVKAISINNLDSFPNDIKNKLNILFIKYPFLNNIEKHNVSVYFVNNKIQASNDDIVKYKSYVVKTIYEKLNSVHFTKEQRDEIFSNIKIELSICTESNFFLTI